VGEVGQLRTGEGQLTSGTCRPLPSRESDVVQPANFIRDQAAIAFTHTRDSDDAPQLRNFTTAYRDLQMIKTKLELRYCLTEWPVYWEISCTSRTHNAMITHQASSCCILPPSNMLTNHKESSELACQLLPRYDGVILHKLTSTWSANSAIQQPRLLTQHGIQVKTMKRGV